MCLAKLLDEKSQMLFRHITVYPVLFLDRIEHCGFFTVIDTCHLKPDTYQSEPSSAASSIDIPLIAFLPKRTVEVKCPAEEG